MSSIEPALGGVQMALDGLAERMQDGHESVEFMFAFWEKFYKIQLAYAKNLEELCGARAAKLHRLFRPTPVEPIDEVNRAWAHTIESLLVFVEEQRTVATAIHDQACKPLFQYGQTEAPKRNESINECRRIIRDLSAAESRALNAKRRYVRSAEDLGRTTDKARLKPAFDKDEEDYQQAIGTFAQLHKQTFNMVLPGILERLEDAEASRVQTVRSATKTAITALTSMDLTTAARSETELNALGRQHASLKCNIEAPTIPEFVRITPDMEAPATPSSEAKPSFFASLFGTPSKADDQPKAADSASAPSAAAVTEATESESDPLPDARSASGIVTNAKDPTADVEEPQLKTDFGHAANEPETEPAEAEATETKASENTTPKTDPPEHETPEMAAPETDTPKIEAAETETPEMEAPETEAPEMEAPETDTPDIDAPETETLEVDAPETDAPETDAPGTDTPETVAPETDASETEILKVESSESGEQQSTESKAEPARSTVHQEPELVGTSGSDDEPNPKASANDQEATSNDCDAKGAAIATSDVQARADGSDEDEETW